MPDSPIVLAGISLAGALIPAALGAYSWSRRSRPGATTLAIVLFSLSVWAFAHSLGFLASGSVFLETLEYSAFLLLAPLWLVFTIEHTGRGTWLTRGALALIASVPLASFILLLINGSPPDGPWFWLDASSRLILVSLGSAFLMQRVFTARDLYTLQCLCLLGGFLAPWIVGMAELFGMDSGPLPASLALILTGLLFTLGILKWRLLDLSYVSPEKLLDSIGDGVLVLDHRNRVTDVNASAERLLGRNLRQALGRDFREVITSAGIAPLEGDRGTVLLREPLNKHPTRL